MTSSFVLKLKSLSFSRGTYAAYIYFTADGNFFCAMKHLPNWVHNSGSMEERGVMTYPTYAWEI